MSWERDEDDRIVEFGVRDADGFVEGIYATFWEAHASVQRAYNRKAERLIESELYLEESALHKAGKGPFPPTNEAWWAWEKRGPRGVPIKDQDWSVVRRTVSTWMPFYG